MAGLLDMLNSPQTAMAAGLLAPTPHGSFGGGVLQGQQAGAAQQRNLSQQQLAKMRLAEAERAAQERKTVSGLLQQHQGNLPALATSLLSNPSTVQDGISLLNAIKQPAGKQSSLSVLQDEFDAETDPVKRDQIARNIEKVITNAPATQLIVNPFAGQLTTLDVPQPDGSVKPTTVRRDSPEAQAAIEAGATPAGTTELKQAELNGLNEIGAKLSNLTELRDSFQDDFASLTDVGGRLENIIGSKTDILGGQDQANWWRRYQEFKNTVRNAQFGGALTPFEGAEFDKAAVTEGMSPDAIKENLNLQVGIVEKATDRLGLPIAQAGRNRAQIESALGKKVYTVGEIIIAPNGKKGKVIKGGVRPEIVEVK